MEAADRPVLRVQTGKFCQVNCLQEALRPVLTAMGCATDDFDYLRFISWEGLSSAWTRGAPAAKYGGVELAELTRLYRIEWRDVDIAELRARPRESTPLLARIDPAALPGVLGPLRAAQGRPLMHWVLVVSVDGNGIHCLDAEHPTVPTSLGWERFAAALRPLDDSQPMLKHAAIARPLPHSVRQAVEVTHLRHLHDALCVPSALVEDAMASVHRGIINAHGAARRMRALEAAAYLNGLQCSVVGARRLLRRRQWPARHDRRLQALEAVMTPLRLRLLRIALGGVAEEDTELEGVLTRVTAAWSAGDRSRVRDWLGRRVT